MIKVTEELIPIQKKISSKYYLNEVLAKLNNPEKKLPTINVVGTNGKGSTSFYLSKGLKQKYNKVGLFISPAFIYQNERIQINNEYISDEDLKKYLKRIDNYIYEYELTFFEIWTLIAILYFADNNVDIVVMEAGIGGKNDSTNLMTNQIATLVTTIDFDHTEILGETIEEILYQKVMIAKKDSPVFISNDNKKYEWIIRDILSNETNKVYLTNIVDDEILYQRGNKGLVKDFLKTLNITDFTFLNSEPPLGRFTKLNNEPLFIIDGAHNNSGIDNLISTFNNKYQDKKPLVLMGSSFNKDFTSNLNKLVANFKRENVYITEFDHFKSWNIEKIEYENKVENWQEFLKNNIDKRDIVVCGSLYFVPQVYEWYNSIKK